MSVPGSANALLLNTAAAGGYQISRSLRFNSSDSAFLSRTPASAGNRKTWTWAGWVKRSKITSGDYEFIFGYASGSTYEGLLWVPGSDKLEFWSSPTAPIIQTTQLFRDPSAWFHIVLACDTTQATASNRVKLYINGSQVTQLDAASYPAQDFLFKINDTVAYNIGSEKPDYGRYFNGYLADIHFIDGQALDPTSFGEFDTNGIWQPKRYSGTYGSNGFKLDFADNSSNTATTLGKDTSGNGNNWTPNNLSASSGGPTSVATASGALPIFNTTDTYGTTKGTGTRTDSNSSSIVLALPMDGANNGTTFTDESATIKGSGSAKSVSRFNAVTSTAQSKFYGSSGLFNGSTAYLSVPANSDFTLASSDYTIEAWIYWSSVSGEQVIVECFSGTAGPGWTLYKKTDNKVEFYSNGVVFTGSTAFSASRWYHIAVTKTSTSYRFYVDGIQDTSSTYANANDASVDLWIGERQAGSQTLFFNGYIQDLRIYKGIAKYTSNFNPPSSTQNATIAAGNDSLVDVPTNGAQTDTGAGGEVRGNYATLNPLAGLGTLANGNLDISGTFYRTSTIGLRSGRWYWEITVGSVVTNSWLGLYLDPANSGGNFVITGPANQFSDAGGTFTVTSSSLASGDIIGIAANFDNGTVTWYKNGSTAVVLAGATLSTRTWLPGCHVNANATTNWTFNAGQRPFAYTAPSGFKALCTANLPAPVVTKPNSVFDVVTYTGTGSSLTPTSSLGFNPDLVWIKSRSAATDHTLYDSVRGAQARLESNTTDAEVTSDNGLTAFNSNGFTLGTLAQVNTNAATYVGWTWDAGSSTVTNTAGSITSSVRANASAGFSIVTYTGTLTSAGNVTIGHGLGVAPSLIITKSRSDSSRWAVFPSAALGANKYLELNTTAAVADSVAVGGGAAPVPTSTVFYTPYLFGANVNGQTFVAYCFAPVAGYSSMGSYVGNGSADGPFVYTGFRPKLLIQKKTSNLGEWVIWDSSRKSYNSQGPYLFANSSGAEGADAEYIDFLSNGFKIKTTNTTINESGAISIYIAFAESPFQYARAR